jgi:spermidine synthase
LPQRFTDKNVAYVLLISVFVIATCGLVYELISGALASYLLGDSVTQFSTVIGIYLFSMGIGSYLSKHLNRNLIAVFVQVELLIGLVGGFSAAILFVAFEHVTSFRVLLYSMVCITGTLVGLEIPILMRILEGRFEFKDLVAKVFTFDYVGALIASLLFPLVLVPHLGLVRSAFLFGILNVLVAIWALFLLGQEIVWAKLLRGSAFIALVALTLGFAYSDKIMSFAETATYQDQVIYATTSKYQRIVLTKSPTDFRLYLNGNLQFSSRDEYRYHEALIHVGMAAVADPRHILVLGGGDGLAAREILKYPTVESVTLVDLDAEMTNLFSQHEALAQLNGGALTSPKVRVVNNDAFVWLQENQTQFDFIVVDFPDPSNYSIGKLYSNTFYRLLKGALNERGAIVVQSTSPYVAKKSFWCVDSTLKSVGLLTTPYHAYVPSFGEWGYVVATKRPFVAPQKFPAGLKFVNAETVKTMLNFPQDMAATSVEVNKLNNQILVRYFEDEWAQYIH